MVSAGAAKPRLIQIVPELPPAVGGIGDHAVGLASKLLGLGIGTVFVLPDRRRRSPRAEHSREASSVAHVAPSPGALAERLDALRSDALLLHYSGYGYARRGAPVWLVRGLQRWKAGGPGRRLVVMFHELWAGGPPWTSSFWIGPVQRALAAGLLRLADAYLTSTDLYALRLRRLAPHRAAAAVLPVPSNIGEPGDLPPFESREPLAVVFGQPATRARVYRHLDAFLPALAAAGIEGLLDIGPPLDTRAAIRPAASVTRCGYLEPASASDAMRRARFGLLDYPLDFAAKSGAFAAYAAHGLVPLIRGAAGLGGDGISHGLNLVRTSQPIAELRSRAPRIAAAAQGWYREHRLERAAACFARALHLPEAAP